MKKFLAVLILLMLMSISVKASDLCSIQYKNIPNKSKISYNPETMQWSNKVNKKNDLYFIKTKGFGSYYDYLNSNKDFAFTTDCEYDFIYNGKFIGYSNSDFMFYEFGYENGALVKSPLLSDEAEKLFPDYKLVKLTEFSKGTNSLKVKKGFGDLKIIVYNDKGIDMKDFVFSTGNSVFQKYPMSGFLDIKKRGMIQLSKEGDSMKNSDWFIILVR